jgi:diamine N-acetyltransferase
MNDNTVGFKVREAVAADAARLAEFGARTFYETFAADNTAEDMRQHLASAWSSEQQLREIADPSMQTLLQLDSSGQWSGFAQLRAGKLSDGVPREGSIELYRFYVDKPWQGRGAAGALMTTVKECARRRGARTMWLGVWERNARAQAFYRKHGFEKVGRQVFVVGSDPQTDDVMLCPLA